MSTRLSKMQINRLETQLSIKIRSRVKEFELENPSNRELADKLNALLAKVQGKLLSSYNKASGLKLRALPNSYNTNRETLAKMLGFTEIKDVVKLRKQLDKETVARKKKVDAYRLKLTKKKDAVLNDAYFKDSEFALKALEDF